MKSYGRCLVGLEEGVVSHPHRHELCHLGGVQEGVQQHVSCPACPRGTGHLGPLRVGGLPGLVKSLFNACFQGHCQQLNPGGQVTRAERVCLAGYMLLHTLLHPTRMAQG